MLVLSRKKNQEIVIDVGGEQVSVVIVDIRGDKTRLGVTTAKHVAVHRREVYDAIEREREREAQHGRLSSDQYGDIPAVRHSEGTGSAGGGQPQGKSSPPQ